MHCAMQDVDNTRFVDVRRARWTEKTGEILNGSVFVQWFFHRAPRLPLPESMSAPAKPAAAAPAKKQSSFLADFALCVQHL
jgi:hypothetical protein